MSDHKKEFDGVELADISAVGGGRVIVPDASRIPPQAEMTDSELDADFDREDDGLLDPGSPEFDHSLRRRKAK